MKAFAYMKIEGQKLFGCFAENFFGLNQGHRLILNIYIQELKLYKMQGSLIIRSSTVLNDHHSNDNAPFRVVVVGTLLVSPSPHVNCQGVQ